LKVITLAALCIVFIITTATSVVYYTSLIVDKDNQISNLEAEAARLNAEVKTLNATIQKLNNEIAQKNNAIAQKNDEIFSLNNQIASLNNQISELNSQIDDLTSQIANKPKIVVDGLNVEDERNSIPYNLHVYGVVNNTGGSTAYNAFLHVVAFNAEGVAIDTCHYFAGITGGMHLGLDFRLNYTGSPIESWFITPIWTDDLIIPLSGTFPP
jgi:chaperonin cofactor prefoldin